MDKRKKIKLFIILYTIIGIISAGLVYLIGYLHGLQEGMNLFDIHLEVMKIASMIK